MPSHALRRLYEINLQIMQTYLIHDVQPIYPEAAKRNSITGTVWMEAIIGPDGRIHRLKILTSPDPNLSTAALVAAQQWEYRPYLVNGEPVTVKTTMKATFSFSNSHVPQLPVH